MPGIGTSGFLVCRRADAASAFCSFSAVIGEWTLKVYVLFFCLNANRREDNIQSFRMAPQEKEDSNDIRNIYYET